MSLRVSPTKDSELKVPAPTSGDTRLSQTQIPAPTSGDTRLSQTQIPAPTSGDTRLSQTQIPARAPGDSGLSQTRIPAPTSGDTRLSQTQIPAPTSGDTRLSQTQIPARAPGDSGLSQTRIPAPTSGDTRLSQTQIPAPTSSDTRLSPTQIPARAPGDSGLSQTRIPAPTSGDTRLSQTQIPAPTSGDTRLSQTQIPARAPGDSGLSQTRIPAPTSGDTRLSQTQIPAPTSSDTRLSPTQIPARAPGDSGLSQTRIPAPTSGDTRLSQTLIPAPTSGDTRLSQTQIPVRAPGDSGLSQTRIPAPTSGDTRLSQTLIPAPTSGDTRLSQTLVSGRAPGDSGLSQTRIPAPTPGDTRLTQSQSPTSGMGSKLVDVRGTSSDPTNRVTQIPSLDSATNTRLVSDGRTQQPDTVRPAQTQFAPGVITDPGVKSSIVAGGANASRPEAAPVNGQTTRATEGAINPAGQKFWPDTKSGALSNTVRNDVLQTRVPSTGELVPPSASGKTLVPGSALVGPGETKIDSKTLVAQPGTVIKNDAPGILAPGAKVLPGVGDVLGNKVIQPSALTAGSEVKGLANLPGIRAAGSNELSGSELSSAGRVAARVEGQVPGRTVLSEVTSAGKSLPADKSGVDTLGDASTLKPMIKGAIAVASNGIIIGGPLYGSNESINFSRFNNVLPNGRVITGVENRMGNSSQIAKVDRRFVALRQRPLAPGIGNRNTKKRSYRFAQIHSSKSKNQRGSLC